MQKILMTLDEIDQNLLQLAISTKCEAKAVRFWSEELEKELNAGNRDKVEDAINNVALYLIRTRKALNP